MSVAALEPRLTALYGPSAQTRGIAGACVCGLFWLSLIAPHSALDGLWAVLCLFFVGATIVRLLVATAALEPEYAPAALAERDLPYYSIVIALYREASVASALVRALEKLDYPRALLDVHFVVEGDDPETYAALAAAIPGVEYQIIVAPTGAPRTKPRALNVALPFVRGELLTVFDAEDAPEPDQLRRAAARFACGPQDLACLQGHLAIDNAGENWLTAFYAIDYAALFEVGNPGLSALGAPIFLGGTSNHFRTSVLLQIGGWDAWNVTEDADLGLRLARCGFKIETFNSRTYEEAPANFYAFLHQRVRWKKGWIQTAFVHLRDPAALYRNLGGRAFFATLTLFVSGVVSPLFWPYFMFFLVRDIWSGDLFRPCGLGAFVASTCACWLLVAGPVATIWAAILGMKRQGLSKLWPYLPFQLVWLPLMTIASWMAVCDLWRNPFGWSKTMHGLTQHRRRS